MICILHFKYFPIDFYGESSSSRRFWIAHQVLYHGKIDTVLKSKDVGSHSTCQWQAYSIGTLLWKVSQILGVVVSYSVALLRMMKWLQWRISQMQAISWVSLGSAFISTSVFQLKMILRKVTENLKANSYSIYFKVDLPHGKL